MTLLKIFFEFLAMKSDAKEIDLNVMFVAKIFVKDIT